MWNISGQFVQQSTRIRKVVSAIRTKIHCNVLKRPSRLGFTTRGSFGFKGRHSWQCLHESMTLSMQLSIPVQYVEYLQFLHYVRDGFPDRRNMLPEGSRGFWGVLGHLSVDDGLIVYTRPHRSSMSHTRGQGELSNGPGTLMQNLHACTFLLAT